tara:strand:- start:329 stop:499 length:171 start_codon:yes stop_codon:yes gene_type:complete
MSFHFKLKSETFSKKLKIYHLNVNAESLFISVSTSLLKEKEFNKQAKRNYVIFKKK